MAEAAARPPRPRRKPSSTPTVRAGRILLAVIDPRRARLPLRGVLVVLAAAALSNWLTSQFNVLTAFRASVVETLGIGVYFCVLLLILAGFWWVVGAGRPRVDLLRRLGGLLTLAVFALGIAAFVQPHWVIGGVSLQRTTAGGALGDALTSAPGAPVMLALALAGAWLVAPRLTQASLILAALFAARAADALQRQAPSLAWRWPQRGSLPDPWLLDDAPTESIVEADPALDEHQLSSDAAADAAAAEPHGSPDSDAEEADLADATSARPRSDDGWFLPSLSLLTPDAVPAVHADSQRQARIIVETLASFGVDATISQIHTGPAVTQFGLEPGWDVRTRAVPVRDDSGHPLLDDGGRPLQQQEEVSRTRVRVNKITRLTNDLALALAAPSIRVEAPVPGQSVIGIEVPNRERRLVTLRGVIESHEFKQAFKRGGLPIALGRNVQGKPVIIDLTLMPHVLIAGATGSGKSVCINSVIACLLTHFSPQAVRLVLVDPKRVELSGYNDVPHLAFSRVITDPDEVVGVLAVVVAEMERRYRQFERAGARNIAAYNADDRPEGKLPYWVVIIDELADLMMAAPIEVEQQLVRLAQLARATGIHLVIATQRPSVDVVTGLIKANFPTRIAFATTSQTDARVIMDRAGAERLLGQGDMLFTSTERLTAQRLQGAYVSDQEITALIEFWTQDRFKTLPRPTLDHLLDQTKRPPTTEWADSANTGADARADTTAATPRETAPAAGDSLYPQALTLARDHTRISASMLQRRLRVGYPRAARLLDQLEADGVVGAAEGGQSRPVVASPLTADAP